MGGVSTNALERVRPVPERRLRLRKPKALSAVDESLLRHQCLDTARRSGTSPLTQNERAALAGRAVQGFIVQSGNDEFGTQSYDRSRHSFDCLIEHGYRLEKQHSLPSVVAERYVALLVSHGYEWQPEEAE